MGLNNAISLRQEVNTAGAGTGCCGSDLLPEILSCVKDLSKDVAKLLEINGLSSCE